MKHVLATLSAIGLLAAAAVVQADPITIELFDVSTDPACWVAPEWKD